MLRRISHTLTLGFFLLAGPVGAQVTSYASMGQPYDDPNTDPDSYYGFKRRPRDIPWKIWWLAMFFVLWALDAHGQSYTAYVLDGNTAPPLSGVITPVPGVPPAINEGPINAQAVAYNGSIYAGSIQVGGEVPVPMIWQNGLSAPGTFITIVYTAEVGGGVLDLLSIDVSGNIIGTDDGLKVPPPYLPTYYLLIPTVNPLQAQVAKEQSQLTAEQTLAASYLNSANGYITMVLAAQQNEAIWISRAKAVAAKCGCSW